MTPVHSGGVWRALLDPSYTLKGTFGENALTTGLALQIARTSNKTLSPDRNNPNAFLRWLRTSELGEFGISTRYSEMATRDTSGADASGRVPATSTSASRVLSGNWGYELGTRSTISADGSYENVAYKGGTYIDYSTQAGGIRIGYALNDQVTSFCRISGNKYSSASGGSSSTLVATTFGMNWKGEYLDWAAQVVETRGGQGATDTGGAVEAHYVGQLTQVNLSAERAVVPSGLGGFVKADQLRGGAAYALSEYSNIGIDLARQKNISTTMGGSASSTMSSAWLDYNLTAIWHIRTYSQYRTNQGGGVESASSNLIGFSVDYVNSDF